MQLLHQPKVSPPATEMQRRTAAKSQDLKSTDKAISEAHPQFEIMEERNVFELYYRKKMVSLIRTQYQRRYLG